MSLVDEITPFRDENPQMQDQNQRSETGGLSKPFRLNLS
jgi:hypothetical protein